MEFGFTKLYRLLALELERYSNLSIQSLYDKFVLNGADIIINENTITVQLKKKRNLPLILEVMQKFSRQKYLWLINKNVILEEASYFLMYVKLFTVKIYVN